MHVDLDLSNISHDSPIFVFIFIDRPWHGSYIMSIKFEACMSIMFNIMKGRS